MGEGPLREERGGGDAPAPRRLGRSTPRPRASTRARVARTSLLVDYTARGEETTADAVRAVLGATSETLPDDEALERALNPSSNRYRLETLNLAVHSPLARALHHSTYTFLKKLSHTADSQDQRHRMVPGSRPLMTFTDTKRPDYVTPPLVAGNARGAGGLRRGHGRGVGRQEPAARAGRAPRAGPLRAAQRQGPALPRDRQPRSTSATSG